MTRWGAALYGDPCRDCGYRWSTTREEAMAYVVAVPVTYADLLRGRVGREQRPDLGWSVTGYVCHVGDNLRIWAERLAGAALGAGTVVSPYDEAALGKARAYDGVALPAALWSLGRAVLDWQEAMALAEACEVVLHHPDRGAQTLTDVARSNAHDAFHHAWDIRRSLGTGMA